MTDETRYPALIFDWLTPVYDLFARLFIPEGKLKRGLIAQAHLTAGQRVLDLGAGTGTLAIMIKQVQPQIHVTGLDGDPAIVAIAREKASRAGLNMSFHVGNAAALPYCNGSFDRVLSSLVLSLLSNANKLAAMREAYRVLQRGGELHIADFGPPHTRWGRRVSPLVRRFEPIAGNLDGLLPAMLNQAGFESVNEAARIGTLFGALSIVSGKKPA